MSCVPSPLSRVSSALRISWAVPLCHLSLRRGASFRFSSSGRARQPCSHSVLAVYCLVVGCFYHALFVSHLVGFSFAWCVLLSFVVDSVDGLLVRSSSSFAALRACRANGVCCDLRGPSPPCPALFESILAWGIHALVVPSSLLAPGVWGGWARQAALPRLCLTRLKEPGRQCLSRP